MSSQRFRRLELEPDAAPPGPEVAALEADSVAAPAFHRALEVGGAPGGGDPQVPAARARAEHAAQRAEAPAAAAHPTATPGAGAAAGAAHAGAHPVPPGTDVLLQEILRESEQRHEPGFGSVVAAGVLLAALFALVWIPVRTALALGSGAPLRARGLLELGCAAVGALWLRRRFRRELDGL